MGKNQYYLRWYTKKYGLKYPETIGDLDISILNNDTFHSMQKTKYDIDMEHIEEEMKKFYFHDHDIELCLPNKEKVSILNIKYTTEEKLSYGLLCSLIEQKVYSFEGYIISSLVILANSSYYSAWVYRRKCLRHLHINLLNELKFTRFIINENIKSFQSWFHRRWLVEYICRSNEMNGNGLEQMNYNKTIGDELEDIDFNDLSNFLSSDEDDNDSSDINEKTNEMPIFNCKEKDFQIKKKNIVLNENIKNITENYDFFKKAIIPNKKISRYELLYEEILYIVCDIFTDKKNYNSWAYKCWLIENFQIFQNKEFCKKYNIILHEFQLINIFLKIDIYNNSFWIYRYFIFNRMNFINDTKKLEKEMLLCLSYAKKFYDNEAIFNYLSNIVFHYLRLKETKMEQEHKKEKEKEQKMEKESLDVDNPHLFDVPIIQKIHKELIDYRKKSKYVLLFLAQLYSYYKLYDKEIQCYKYLKEYDHFHDQIWKYRIEEIKKEREVQT